MSNPSTGKGGMEFFKKFAPGNGSGLFGGMKIKGPKQKGVAQTQTNFNFAQKSSQQIKPSLSTVDDIGISQDFAKKQQKQSVTISQDMSTKPIFIKPIEFNSLVVDKSIKNHRNSQSSQSEKKIEVKVSQKQIGKDINEIVVEKPQKKMSQEIKNQEIVGTRNNNQQKSHVQSPTFSQKTKPERPIASIKKTQSDNPVKKAPEKRKVEQEKTKKSDRQQVLDEINDYNIKLANIIFKQRQIQEHICKCRETINELTQKITHWVTEQGLCAQRQEYDIADRLQTQIQENQNRIDELQIQLNFGEQQLIKKQNEEISLLKTQNSNVKRIGRRLKLIELQLQDDAANIKRQQQQKIQDLKNKQQVQRKRVQRIEKDISYQNQQIAQLEKVFKQELQGKINPLIQDKKSLQEDKIKLQSEIKQLQKKLKEKKAELSDKNKKLKGVNEGINEVNQSFKQQISRLQQRKHKLQNMENQRVQMQKQMTIMEKNIESQTKSMDAKVDKKIIQALELAQIAKCLQQKQTHFDDEIDLRKVAFDNFLINGKILKQFQSKHKEEREKVKQLQYKKNNIASEISRLQQKKEVLKLKIPALQSEQKKFADQKNYKAAALKKNEIKQLNDDMVKIKKDIQNYFVQQHALQMELQDMTNSQKECNEEQGSLRYNLAVSQHRHYTGKINKIEEYREEIQRASNMNEKERQKLIKQLILQYQRYTEQLDYLNTTYGLGIKSQQKIQQPDADGIQAENQAEDEQLIEQTQAKEDNNQLKQDQQIQKYQPPNLQNEQNLEEEDEGGYVPLQLD